MSLDRGHQLIEQVLREHYGDAFQSEEPRQSNGHDPDRGRPCAQLNDAAMKNLGAWVPELAVGKSVPGIYGLRRTVGRYPTFVGVASWRVPEGEDISQWNRNLKIVSSGINDFASGEKFTPIDLV